MILSLGYRVKSQRGSSPSIVAEYHRRASVPCIVPQKRAHFSVTMLEKGALGVKTAIVTEKTADSSVTMMSEHTTVH